MYAYTQTVKARNDYIASQLREEGVGCVPHQSQTMLKDSGLPLGRVACKRRGEA